MNIRRLPSGSYQVRKMINGKTYTISFNHKPSQREIDAEIFRLRKTDGDFCDKGSFKDYAEQFISIKTNVLSPTTVKNYRSILKNMSDAFCALEFAQISQANIQKEINLYSVGRSPKSVKNASGFITAVMWMFRPDMPIRTKLPQRVRVETYIPTDDEVKKLLAAIHGSSYEPAILLMVLGLRKSEAIAVTKDDIKKTPDGYMLTIDKAKVVTEDGTYQTKTTKTESSTRTIWIPDELAKMIISRGAAYEGFPGNILRYLHRTQDALGINRCKLHALRHYYVSSAHAMGVPDATIAKAVGHSSIATTQAVYTHAIADKQIESEKRIWHEFGTTI